MFLLVLFVVNAQSLGQNCSQGGKCDSGLFCNDMNMKCCDSSTGSCTAPPPTNLPSQPPSTQSDLPISPPSDQIILPPPPYLPEKQPSQPEVPITQLPPSFTESYCGDGRLDSSREQCDGSSQEQANTACPAGYYCTKECQCKTESIVRAPAQCPEGTMPVKEGDMLYCYKMPEEKAPEPVSQACAPKVFYIPAGEKKTELRFTLPWIPENSELTKGGKTIPVYFEGQELILALEEGDYLISVYKNGEKHDLPVQVLKSPPEIKKVPEKISLPIDAEIIVHAQNNDEEQGKMLASHLSSLGMNAVFSNARNVEAVSTAQAIIFLGGHLANNLVGKYFPDISESLYNLNSNRLVKQAGNQFVMALAGWCGDATEEAANELSEELSYELESSEEKASSAREILKSTKKRIGKKTVCMPDEPELLENRKSGKRVSCPNQEICDAVCGLKELELYANDDAYNDFGMPTRRESRWNGKSCSCTIYYESNSEEAILYHDSDMPINANRYCSRGGKRNLASDIDEAEENARQKTSQRYADANIRGKSRIVNDLLKQRACDGGAACQAYCKYELNKCKNGLRNKELQNKDGEKPYYDYPKNDCAGYNQASSNYDPRDASCSCTFLSDEYEFGLDPDYMNPSMVNYFCDRIEEMPEQPRAPVEKRTPPREEPPQPQRDTRQAPDLPAPRGRDISRAEEPAAEVCSSEEICEYSCINMLYNTRGKYSNYEYSLENSGCFCKLTYSGRLANRGTTNFIPIQKIVADAADEATCAEIKFNAQNALSELGLKS